MGSFSIWHWLIVLLVVVLIFGTKKLRNMGGDVGGAVKNFKEAMNQEQQDDEVPLSTIKKETSNNLIDVAVVELPAPKAAPRKRAAAKPKAELKPATVKASVAKSATAKPTAAKKAAATKPTTTKSPG